MSQSQSLENDKSILKKKIQETQGTSKGSLEAQKKVRSLRKYVKRIQRKVRARAARIAQASGKKGATAS
ncbi:MAG: hypothetical protein GKS05_03855 [Nitrospirales bacterium]|nr:hypothetical protein [Nitrospirales bacterium]